MQHRWINNLTSRPLSRLLQSSVSYWHKQHYSFRLHSEQYQLDIEPAKKPGRIVIVSRAHYQEFIQQYPITRLSELKQILQTEYSAGSAVMHYIGPVQGERRTVCTFVFSADFIAQLPHLCLLLPETLLMWQSQRRNMSAPDDTLALHVKAQSNYFLYCADTVPVSQPVSAFCSNFDSFSLNTGIPDTTRLHEVKSSTYAEQLSKAFGLALPRLLSYGRLFRPEIHSANLPLKKLAVAASLVLITYSLGVAAYYQVAIASQQQKLANLGNDVSALLDLQQKLLTNVEHASVLAELRSGKYYSAHIWQLLLPLIDSNLELGLQNISSQDNRLVLRGQATQATAILSALQESPTVIDARFDDSVRRQRERDFFVISLTLRQEPTDGVVRPDAEANNASE